MIGKLKINQPVDSVSGEALHSAIKIVFCTHPQVWKGKEENSMSEFVKRKRNFKQALCSPVMRTSILLLSGRFS